MGWDISRDIIARIEGRNRVVSDLELAQFAQVLGALLEKFYPPEIQRRLQKTRT